MKKSKMISVSLACVMMISASGAAAFAEAVETDDWNYAPLAFDSADFRVSGGNIAWNPDTMEWAATFPTSFAQIELDGTYAEDGTLTLVNDSTGGHIGGDMPAIQEVFTKAMEGREYAPLEFDSADFRVTGGVISWDEDTMEWAASFPTSFAQIELDGTYTEDGTLTVVNDSTGGHIEGDIPAIQAVFQDALSGKRHAPLAFDSADFHVSGGTISWDENSMEWDASFPTSFAQIELDGTYAEDGTLTVVNDSTGGHISEDMPKIQQVFTDALHCIYVQDTEEERDPNEFSDAVKELPGNAEEYSFDAVVPMENSPLEGKAVYILGSSVTFGQKSLGNAVGEYLAKRMGFELTKEAVSGTTLVDDGEKSYIQRMLANSDSEAHYDLFICQLSTNDATKKLPLGEISDSEDIADFDTTTVTGAMEYIIGYAKQTWGCPVVFFTGSYYESPEYSAMVDRVEELKEKWGIGVLNLYDSEEFNSISEEDRALYMNDEQHPTMAGYRDWWGPELEAQLVDFLK